MKMENGQACLWYDSIDEAIRQDVHFLGGSKKVGAMLRPELEITKASEWLMACLNPERREKLDINQYTLIMKEAKQNGSLNALTQILRDCECADPIPLEPDSEKARLQKQFVKSVADMKSILAQLDGISGL